MILLKLLWPVLKIFIRKIEGIDNIPVGQCLIASNHSSKIDAIILLSLFIQKGKHIRFFATNAEKYKTPWWDWWFNYVKAIRINGSLDKGLKAARKGATIGIFPEGYLSPDGRIHKPKGKGLGVIAIKTGIPVLPVRMNTFWWWNKHQKYPSFKRNIEIRIGKQKTYEIPYTEKNAEKITKETIRRIRTL